MATWAGGMMEWCAGVSHGGMETAAGIDVGSVLALQELAWGHSCELVVDPSGDTFASEGPDG